MMILRPSARMSVLGSNGTENALKVSSSSLVGRLGRVSQRSQLPALNRIGQREGIPTQQVDVIEYQGREAGKVLRLYRENPRCEAGAGLHRCRACFRDRKRVV